MIAKLPKKTKIRRRGRLRELGVMRVILAGERVNRRHPTKGFCENVAVTETCDQMLEFLSFCGGGLNLLQ